MKEHLWKEIVPIFNSKSLFHSQNYNVLYSPRIFQYAIGARYFSSTLNSPAYNLKHSYSSIIPLTYTKNKCLLDFRRKVSTTKLYCNNIEIKVLQRNDSDPPFPNINSFVKHENKNNKKNSVTSETAVDSESVPVENHNEKKIYSAEDREKAAIAADRAKAAEELWDTFVPDRKIGFTSPVFWILAGSCMALHLVNASREQQRSEEINEANIAEEQLREEAKLKQKKREEITEPPHPVDIVSTS